MSMDTDDIVYKRQNKGRIYKDITKRVSFSEDVIDDHKIRELRIIDRTDSDEFDTESKKIFIDGYEEDKYEPRNFLQTPKVLLKETKYGHKKPERRREFPPFFERGVPEGQEDPKRYSSTPNLSEVGSDCDSCKDLNDVHQKAKIFKSLMVRRFLKSIPMKKPVVKQKDNRVKCLYVKNIVNIEIGDHSAVTNAINEEVLINRRKEDSCKLNPFLEKLVGSNEVIYKAYKVLKVNGSPLLAVITSDSLYFLAYCHAQDGFSVETCCPFKNLVAAVVGPFYQIVIVLSKNMDNFYLNTGISKTLASKMISHLEVAMRRWSIAHKKSFQFNVAEIIDFKYIKTFYDVLPEDAFEKGETILGQYSIWLQEDYVSDTESPLGPQKDGFIMTKIGVGSKWTASYVCLNGGVVYVFEKISMKIPKFAIPLRTPFYKGCRIHNDLARPHSFELVLDGDLSFEFGAADETEMIDWIQALYLAASKVCNRIVDCDKESRIVNCFATLTSGQILLHQFPNKIISRAFLDDVTDFKKSDWTQNFFCVLEFDCREASEMGGDWILYFVSQDSFDCFCKRFTEITNRTGMETQFDNHRFFTSKSDRICAQIRASWNSFFI